MSRKFGDPAYASLPVPDGADVLLVKDVSAGATKQTTIAGIIAAVGNFLHPIGHVLISYESANPATYLGFGTWVAECVGRFLVGIDPNDTDFDAAGDTGGEKTHALTTSEMPVHTHTQDAHGHGVTDPGHSHLTQRYPTATGGSSGFTIDTSMSGTIADNTLPTKAATTGLAVNNATAVNQNAGGGGAHNNLPPFQAIYVWRRSA